MEDKESKDLPLVGGRGGAENKILAYFGRGLRLQMSTRTIPPGWKVAKRAGTRTY